MLYVQTSNPKEQALLEEQFNGDGNVYGVPLKRTKPIEQQIEAIKFEVFLEKNSEKKNKRALQEAGSVLTQKITQLLSKFLNNKICLNLVREIFKLIKHQQQKLDLYEQHILHLNQMLMEEDYESEKSINMEELEIQGLFQDLLQAKIRSVMTLESQMNLQDQNEASSNQTSEIKIHQQVHSLKVIGQEEITISNQQPEGQKKNRMHSSSLRFQIPQTPTFKESLEDILAKKNQKFRKEFLDESFEEDSCGSEQQMVQSPKFRPSSDSTTNQTLYYPSWRKESDEQKKILEEVLGVTSGPNKSMSKQEFLENLSGHFKPMPSILNDDSISDIVRREKKQDIRKSNIFKESMHGYDRPLLSERMYRENIKMVKFHNKLNKKINDKGRVEPKTPTFGGIKQEQLEKEYIHSDDKGVGLFKKQKTQKKAQEKGLRTVKSDDNLRKANLNEQPLEPLAAVAPGFLGSITGLFKFKKAAINNIPNNRV